MPWRQINNVFNSSAKELIILSDGQVTPSDLIARNTYWYRWYGIYFQGSGGPMQFGYLPKLYLDYNMGPRSSKPLLIRSVSLDLDFCAGQRVANLNWLSKISSGNCKLL